MTAKTITENDPAVLRAVLSQGDPPHAGHLLGEGPSGTIKRMGCTLTGLCSISRYTGARLDIDPLEANNQGRQAACFVDRSGTRPGNRLLVAKLAPKLGLRAEGKITIDDGTADDESLRELLLKTLDDGGCALLFVDTNDDGLGNHYVSALGRVEGGDILVMDPDGGHLLRLPFPALRLQPAHRSRPYVVRGMRPIFRA